MKRLLLRWSLVVVALILASVLTSSLGLPFQTDFSGVASVVKLFIGVALLALLNATLGNLLKLLTLPLNCMTLGLVSLVINAAMLEIVSNLDMGFKVGSFFAAFVGSLFFSALNSLLGTLLPDKANDD